MTAPLEQNLQFVLGCMCGSVGGYEKMAIFCRGSKNSRAARVSKVRASLRPLDVFREAVHTEAS